MVFTYRYRRAVLVPLVVVALLAGTGPGVYAGPGTPDTPSARRAAADSTARAGASSVSTAAVTPVDGSAASARSLGDAALDGPIRGASFVHVSAAGANATTTTFGNYTPYGYGALLTTGDASLADDPNGYQSSGRDNRDGTYRGARTYDVTVLKVDFTVPAGMNCLQLGFRFYTEEYPEFSDATYDDAFIAELDSLGWSTSGTTISAPGNFAVGATGTMVSSRYADELGMTAEHAQGTTYDAATPMNTARAPITPGDHSLYLSIFDQYDAVYDSAVLVDRVTTSNQPSCAKGYEEPLTPTVFVPGILGTKMYKGDDERWPQWRMLFANPWDGQLDDLKLQADGVTDEESGVHTGDVLMDLPTYPVYSQTLKKLKSRGFRYDDNGVPAHGETLFFHPTDWRRSAGWNAAQLLDHINRIRAATGYDKVNIIAHSQGGLAVRALLELPGSVGRVNRVVTLGTPYLGTPQALTMLVFKEPCMTKVIGICVISRDKLSEIGTNFPGYLELLSSPALWSATGPEIRTEPIGGPVKTWGFDDFLAQRMGGFNTALLNNAAGWHRANDDFTPADSSVGLMRIVGDHYYTVSGLTEQEYLQCSRFGCVRKWRYVVNQPGKGQPGNGDGLVLLASANPSTHAGKGITRYVYADHDHLDENDASLDYALEVFKGTGPLSTAEADAADAIVGANTPLAAGDQPQALDGVEVTVDGPASGLFTDRDGWRTGEIDPATKASASDIPGSSYVPSTDRSVTFLAGTQADGRWSATGAGEFRLILRAYAGDAVTKTVAYPAIQLPEGAIVTLDALTAPLGTAPALRVDTDADGTVDRTVAPLAPVTGADTDAPVTTVTATPYTATDGTTRYRVTATAADSGGAGIDGIEWVHSSIGPDTYQPYTTALDLPRGGTIYLRATDRAGNVELNPPVVTLP